jgi:hypothetical protein
MKGLNEQNSLFDFIASFLNSLDTSILCSWHPPVQKVQQVHAFFQAPPFQKKDGPFRMKSATFFWTWIFS